MSMIDLLVITAHPDDAEIGVGGMLLKAKRQGHKTGLIICTRGEAGGLASPETRMQEARTGAAILGIEYFRQLDFPDAGVEVNAANMERLIPFVRECAPQIVLTTHPDDYHPDHRAISQLVDQTVFVAGLKKHAADQTTWHPWQMFYFSLDPRTNRHRPDVIIDISDVWAQKKQALDAHASQNITAAVEGWAQYLGMLGNFSYGEGLYLKQPLKLSAIETLCPKWSP
jgi:bacillithiol biosynthesis deacetylase BshB1